MAYKQQEIGFEYMFLVPLISLIVAINIFNFRLYWFINAGDVVAYSGAAYIFSRRVNLAMVFWCP